MREYLTVFLAAAVITYLLGVIAREIALRTGAVAKVRDRDVHAIPIPYFGGVAMLGGLAAGYAVAQQLPFLSLSDEKIFRDAGVVLVAGGLICAVGVLDDLLELDALTKFGGQLLISDERGVPLDQESTPQSRAARGEAFQTAAPHGLCLVDVTWDPVLRRSPIREGRPFPLGATWDGLGVNFAT